MKSKEKTHYDVWKFGNSQSATDMPAKCYAGKLQSLAINTSGIFMPNARNR
jgi:hypothetical protein